MLDDTALLRRITELSAVSDALRHLQFDVEDLGSVDGSSAHLLSGQRLELVACDGAQGRYFLVGPEGTSRPVLQADSEGFAGLIGPSLATALATIIALPNWRDLLGFSGGGDLGQMRRAQTYFQHGMRRDYPDLAGLQAWLSAELELPALDDPVLTLWHSVRATVPQEGFLYDDGPWGSLFHEWTIERLMKPGATAPRPS